MSLPTEITIHPRYDEPIFGVRTLGDTDHISGKDVARAANPLHQIPFVSQVYEAATGETGSAAAKLIGGALIGGPFGFLASLATVIFEQESGKSVIGAVASAFSGDDATTQVASTETNSHLIGVQEGKTIASAESAPVVPVTVANAEILPPEKPLDAQRAAMIGQKAQMNLASAITDIDTGVAKREQDADVLALFGGQNPSAHKSYQKAQMLPYLRDVNTSLVM